MRAPPAPPTPASPSPPCRCPSFPWLVHSASCSAVLGSDPHSGHGWNRRGGRARIEARSRHRSPSSARRAQSGDRRRRHLRSVAGLWFSAAGGGTSRPRATPQAIYRPLHLSPTLTGNLPRSQDRQQVDHDPNNHHASRPALQRRSAARSRSSHAPLRDPLARHGCCLPPAPHTSRRRPSPHEASLHATRQLQALRRHRPRQWLP